MCDIARRWRRPERKRAADSAEGRVVSGVVTEVGSSERMRGGRALGRISGAGGEGVDGVECVERVRSLPTLGGVGGGCGACGGGSFVKERGVQGEARGGDGRCLSTGKQNGLSVFNAGGEGVVAGVVGEG